MTYKKRLIGGFKVISFLVLPAYAFGLFICFDRSLLGGIFFFFVALAAGERYWETYLSSKERHREEFHGDWTLALMSISYILLFFIFISEFYILRRTLNYSMLVFGILFTILSLRLRFWGMRALGKQWAVHAVGAQKIKKVRLIKLGPYKYIRHPIYLGIIFEVLGFPLLASSIIGVVYAIVFCIPIMLVRARVEENNSLRRFGEKYISYIEETDFLFPFKMFKFLKK